MNTKHAIIEHSFQNYERYQPKKVILPEKRQHVLLYPLKNPRAYKFSFELQIWLYEGRRLHYNKSWALDNGMYKYWDLQIFSRSDQVLEWHLSYLKCYFDKWRFVPEEDLISYL